MEEKGLARPYLFSEDSKALVITAINPNSPQGGSSNLMRNFLLGFRKDSFIIVTSKSRGKEREPILPTNVVLTDYYKYRKPTRWLLGPIFKTRDTYRVNNLIKKYGIEHILLVYPHLYNVEIFLRLQLPKSVKVVGYFHDTFVEGQSGRVPVEKLYKIHNSLLQKIDKLFVMNEGMQSLYLNKYKLDTIALEHSYPEYDIQAIDPSNYNGKKVFWGGNVVGYNATSLKRMADVAIQKGYQLEVATRQKTEAVSAFLNNQSFEKTFYSDRQAYLSAVTNSSFLILALNWPDENDYHIDEISTIFSTKTIEYLTSGVPIILHAPDNYFMSEFIIKHQCGYVIDTRDVSEMTEKFDEILKSDHSNILEGASRAAAKFNPKVVRKKWLNGIKDLI